MLKNWKTSKSEGNGTNWRTVDEILLSSLDYVPVLALDGVEIHILMAHFLPGIVSEGYKAADHVHDVIHIQFVLEGLFRFTAGHGTTLLKPGDGLVIPAGLIHGWLCERAGVLFGASIGVAGRLAKDFMEYTKKQSAGSFLSCSNPELPAGLSRIIELALEPVPFHWRREMIGRELSLWQARALHTALDLRQLKTPVPYRQKRQTDPSRRLCEEAVRFIVSNFNRPFKVREVAGHIGVTPRHLGRLFRVFLQDTPHAFLLRTRLEHAAKMLKESPAMKIKEIAFASGFRTAGHFSQCFKRYFGRSPTGRF